MPYIPRVIVENQNPASTPRPTLEGVSTTFPWVSEHLRIWSGLLALKSPKRVREWVGGWGRLI